MQFSDRAKDFGSWTAVYGAGRTWSYTDLLKRSEEVAAKLLDGKDDLQGSRVAFMIAPSFNYLAVQWGIWRAGGVAVPLSLVHPEPELEYVLKTVRPTAIIADQEHTQKLQDLSARLDIPFFHENQIPENKSQSLPEIDENRPAMILFTSGTTSRPKGVVSTHANIRAQVSSLSNAWDWSENDFILSVLPLHHTHGIINVLATAMWNGAPVEFIHPFNPETVWERMQRSGANLFMAVPTIYKKLIKAWENADPMRQEKWSNACRQFRLMVSGSAALPVSILEQWEKISGHRLLERYGMTEIGMALSNPLKGERRPGYVGMPLPGVVVRLSMEGHIIQEENQEGEIQVKGPTVFKEYWERPEANKEAFTEDGWFKTGDVAMLREGYYRILGRSSVDIIKSGGYKISALEIEEVLRQFKGVADCAVVGVPDEEWGEIVSAAIILENGAIFAEEDMKQYLNDRLAPYKVPRIWKRLDELPRNALGKVVKPALKELFSSEFESNT